MFTAPIGLLNPNVGGGYPAIIDDGNTMLWVDAQENITKDGSDLVSVWGDKSGNGNDLLQALGANKPLDTGDGILLADTDNFMKTDTFTLVQPEFIYIVFKQVSFVSGRYVFDGFTNNKGFLRAQDADDTLRAYAGAFSPPATGFTINTFGILRVLFNGASSKIIVNENTPQTGNFGSNDMSGFTLGRSTANANIQYKEIILRKIADTAQNEQDIYDYLAAKYSI